MPGIGARAGGHMDLVKYFIALIAFDQESDAQESKTRCFCIHPAF